MKNLLWAAVHETFQEVNDLLQKARVAAGTPFGGFAANPGMADKSTQIISTFEASRAAGGGSGGAGQKDAMVELRSGIRRRLDLLKTRLDEHLTERESYLVLFPVVVAFDEKVQHTFPDMAQDWPPLQKELFGVDNGGEMVFTIIDDLLRKPETLPFVFQVIYLCLADGFEGKYKDDVVKRNEVERKLRNRIPMPDFKPSMEQEVEEKELVVLRPVWMFYGVGAALFLVAWVGLWFLARL